MNMRFDQLIATGGIGLGILFESNNNRSLDRNESRLAVLKESKDYCKQHIILHYIATVLSNELHVYAMGMVGEDDSGIRLIKKMQSVGINTDMVGQTSTLPTMFSVCLQYPDNCVCNITTANSACILVTPQYIHQNIEAKQLIITDHTLILAVPEVSVEARLALLNVGKSHLAFCVASILCDEAKEFINGGGIELCDLLSINETEAKVIANVKSNEIESIIVGCSNYLSKINPEISLIVTCGEKGSYSFYRGKIEHIPARKANPISTAGAGDAYIAGVICGLSMGLPFQNNGEKDCITLRATDLGSFFAEKSVESEHTITEEIDRTLFNNFMKQEGVLLYGI